jgi:hypothetical protein
MPNWCYNKLTVKGPKLLELLEFVKCGENEFSLNAIIPMPEELKKISCGNTSDKDGKELHNWINTDDGPVAVNEKDLKRKYGAINWYDWACDNWGTKWDVSDVVIESRPKSLVIRFTTAWGPPNPVLAVLAKKFPSLKFSNKWNEEGGCKGHDTF